MFYLKYRPRTIEELDNLKVKEVVKKILSAKSMPHAFLFVGQKGTGKTSTARILAKAINCLKRNPQGPSEPCNNCKNCLSIDSFSSPDVVELDAASNRGIEDIKNLIKESNFYPMSNQYRVYIIDEAHMITNDAFNALLKTLEEPPKSVVFILATTNQEKIPSTIHSRCILINFGRASKTEIVSMLKKIVKLEKINIDESVLGLIAQHSDHSFRDATKTLEELVTQKKLSYEEGKQFLGLLHENFFVALQKKDLGTILSWIEDFNQSGGNYKHLIERLLDNLRLALLTKSGVKSEEDNEIALDVKDIVILMKLLTEAYNNLKISPIESLPLEIAVVEYYNRKKL
ncbi:DNA polymerase III, subunit gamma and tau [Candidatus Roizmanbacteria bacterium RIFCSPLOWO2_01_FULL_37_12]|uniref:DNA polymerase III subunit gamma/tau n=1 Tax=Candidatus Roizmanbacteria bacterium RIFCSPLOWO2_01_FULL_37_12 TaxID=1802056 RepID=A0A1F7IAJ3_9BACT|nr:MAG: DNA polymerase III, subunit gamma and tau [Candidatus Roizmanbacteria bacterium RIFCSPHIGHO2_02_FULL_37_9b]OGK40359.1 MAG: DNA polymerase III, subunit gamma and tau [Candidatus Roizmanbacteria bacterium RIFCSPLOWO2_01_FULL_37_12]